MSTRATIHFVYPGAPKPTPIIYRHSDGYPEDLGMSLREFIKDVSENVPDNRFSDPSYLAAKWVVFDVEHYARRNEGNHPLQFRSVGVLDGDPGDIDYRYTIVCDGKPTLKCERTRTKEPVIIPELTDDSTTP